MFGTTLQRMIFFELVRVFLLALIALTSLFLLAGLVAEATQRGFAPSQIHDESFLYLFEIFDIECHQLTPPEPAGEPKE